MGRAYLSWISWSVIIALAIWLRMHGLSERPIHADEATGARILAERLEGNGYEFSPTHFHGPFLSFISQPIARLKGEHDWSSLSVHTLRLGVVVAGILTVLTPLLWLRQIGQLPAFIAGALLATSPLLVYYNRMFIHESWLVLFGLVSLYAICRLLDRPSVKNSLLAGVFVGLMFATKETFVISIISWALASLAYLYGRYKADDRQLEIAEYLKSIAIGGITAILVGAVFFSNWFTQPQAILDAFQTFFVYETTPGHEKHLIYYLELLVWPKHTLGHWWTEGLVCILSIAAVIHIIVKRKNLPFLLLVLVSSIAHLVIYSCIAYKTPWLMLLPWAHFCLLAALAFSDFQQQNRLVRGMLLGVLILGLGYQTKQSLYATGSFSNDARNPYAYVPTSKDIQSLESWLVDLDSMQPIEPIAVVGSGYWPLPWYLKNFETIGYWPNVNEEMLSMPVVISMQSQSEECEDLLQSTHTALPRSLRENVSMTLFLRNDLWQLWSEESP